MSFWSAAAGRKVGLGDRPFVSVIIPVHNGGSDFASCLQALTLSTFDDWELIVVDDGSTDGSDSLASEAADVLLFTGGRAGPAAARNLGAERARGQWLCFLDADCSVHPDSLQAAMRVIAREPGIDAVFGSYDDTPSAPGIVSRFKNLQHHFVHQRGERRAETFWTGFGLVRRDVFMRLGGLDATRYRRSSIEDIELGYRMREAGCEIRLVPEALVTHHKKWSLWRLIRSDIFDRGLPWSRLIAERRNGARELNLAWHARFSVVLGVTALLALVGALLWPPFFWLFALSIVILIVLNQTFYRFLLRRGGVGLAVAGIGLHWLYQVDCAVAFVLGRIEAWRDRWIG